MKFVKVPAGSFLMGTVQNCPEPDPFTSRDAYEKCTAKVIPDETPAHRVTLKMISG
jgi:formylglycine-generating enzyme required for sulfatase activity